MKIGAFRLYLANEILLVFKPDINWVGPLPSHSHQDYYIFGGFKGSNLSLYLLQKSGKGVVPPRHNPRGSQIWSPGDPPNGPKWPSGLIKAIQR